VLDDLWYLAEDATQRAEQAYHDLTERNAEFLTFERSRQVSRRRFRTLARRVAATGAPYGAHTAVSRPSGELLLVRHEGVDLWVLPGGEPEGGESFREAAERELGEEAGVAASYDGLAMVTRYRFRCREHDAWGVLPVFAARSEDAPTVADPDGEISAARWFDDLPADTRDREELLAWRERALDGQSGR
jgi:8-oxo-dGTP diphosphatase